MTEFQSALLAWYGENGRDLPWRRVRDPYSIWVSEIMCQQTTVAAVIPFYERWMLRFPTVEALAGASVDEVLAHWQGLGYYRRARMLWEGAKFVVESGWPGSVAEWRAVPGVGDYTAGAISSICLGLAAPVVDGNVSRVFARLEGCEMCGTALNKAAWRWAESVLVGDRAGKWNQAMMELGALVCTPRSPDCGGCPVSEWCVALKESRVGELPVPKAKTEWVELRHAMWIPVRGSKVGLRQIPAGQWWEGMWEFPREVLSDEGVLRLREVCGEGDLSGLGEIKHVVTKHKISVVISVLEVSEGGERLEWVERGDLERYALPTPVRKALELWIKAETDGYFRGL